MESPNFIFFPSNRLLRTAGVNPSGKGGGGFLESTDFWSLFFMEGVKVAGTSPDLSNWVTVSETFELHVAPLALGNA